MSTLSKRTALGALTLLILSTAAARGGEWTAPVEVQYDFKPCVAYQARLAGEFLVVRAALQPGWHTFAMDNKQRAEEKLHGRPPLSIDAPTEIKLSQGLDLAGPWYQSPPKDFSHPELQWFSWGFEGQAQFVAKIRRSGAGPAQIAITGQACTATICKKVDVAISLPLPRPGTDAGPSSIDLKALVRARQPDQR
ncbi:MAG TPA: hypothetical protein VEU62_10105 [Bryobacterales bacterium]|nr:hypothetical protein [Bryobacterales bacterium]